MNSVVTQRFIKCHNKLKEENRIRSSRQFALSLDYLPQGLSEIINGRRDVTIELLRKAVERYKINPVYIYTGAGPMFMTDEDKNNFKVLTIITNPQKEERIVHVPSQALSAYATSIHNPDFIDGLPSFSLPDYQYRTNTYRCFEVCNDAMEHSLYAGDKVICGFIEPGLWENTIKNNYVYAIVKRGEVLIRRVINKIPNENQLELICDNDYYAPEVISLADVQEMWLVKSKLSPYLPTPVNERHKLKEELKELKLTINQQSKLINALQNTIDQLIEQREESV